MLQNLPFLLCFSKQRGTDSEAWTPHVPSHFLPPYIRALYEGALQDYCRPSGGRGQAQLGHPGLKAPGFPTDGKTALGLSLVFCERALSPGGGDMRKIVD